MLTTSNFSGSRTDGRHPAGIDLMILPVQWSPKAEARVVELLRADMSVGAVLDTCAAEGLEMRREWVGRIAARAGIELRRGRKSGSGLKGSERREQRSIYISPEVWREVEATRGEGESLNDAVERVLRRGLTKNNY